MVGQVVEVWIEHVMREDIESVFENVPAHVEERADEELFETILKVDLTVAEVNVEVVNLGVEVTLSGGFPSCRHV